jgi:hypothetical protein
MTTVDRYTDIQSCKYDDYGNSNYYIVEYQ